jgi:hypothetical protein
MLSQFACSCSGTVGGVLISLHATTLLLVLLLLLLLLQVYTSSSCTLVPSKAMWECGSRRQPDVM